MDGLRRRELPAARRPYFFDSSEGSRRTDGRRRGVCDACGTALIVRPDDAPETVRDRLHVYHEQTEPLKGFYEKLGLLHSVENVGSIEDVSREIFRSLGIVE